MKPTKNRVFCMASKKTKMVFESKEKADNFLRFNYSEILEENETAPIRSYYCDSCGAYHITSKVKQCPKELESVGQEKDFFICSKGTNSDFNALIDALEEKMSQIELYIHYSEYHMIDTNIQECHQLIKRIKEYPVDRTAYCSTKLRKLNALITKKETVLSNLEDLKEKIENEEIDIIECLLVIKCRLQQNDDHNNTINNIYLFPPISAFSIKRSKPEIIYFYLQHIKNLFTIFDYYYGIGEYELAVSVLYYARSCFKRILEQKNPPQFLDEWFTKVFTLKMNEAKKVVSIPLKNNKHDLFQKKIGNIINAFWREQRKVFELQREQERKEYEQERIDIHNRMTISLIDRLMEVNIMYKEGDINSCREIIAECLKIKSLYTLIRLDDQKVFDQISKWEKLLGAQKD